MLISNVKKAFNYYKKNGFVETWYASCERISQKRIKYNYEAPGSDELNRQSNHKFENNPLISIIVPAYETNPLFIEDLVLSVEEQTYTNYELIIADASETSHVSRMVRNLKEQYENITYIKLEENKGISENTNKALEAAGGEYIALLDHDDLITPDALYEVVNVINKCKKKKVDPVLIYSDEDKTDTYNDIYYDANIKGTFNNEMIATNNYICHLSVYRKDVINILRLRSEYDGAQDYDLVLRTLLYCRNIYKDNWKDYILHIPKVLYHWRCHEESTAQNPESKLYAYEAGQRAVENYVRGLGYDCKVTPLKHLGFYRVEYNGGILRARADVGAVGGPVFRKNVTIGGIMDAKGKCPYAGLNIHYSGRMNRAVLMQDAEAVDIRNILIRPTHEQLFKKTTGLSYPISDKQRADISDEEFIQKSLLFCNKLRRLGITILYDPMMRAEDR